VGRTGLGALCDEGLEILAELANRLGGNLLRIFRLLLLER
jgi:hypothetical protein